MKLFVFCLLLLPFAALVDSSPLKAESPNVLNFLKEALATTTEKTIPETITEGRNSSGRPVKQQDSEDLSDQKSTESLETTKYPQSVESDQSGGESKDLDSHEILVHKDVANKQIPARRISGRSQNNVQPVEMTRRLAPDQESQQQSQGEVQASGDQTDQNSTLLTRQRAGQSMGFQRWAGRADRRYHGLVLDRSREAPDWDSLEENQGRMPPGYNSRPRDYDESRESTSSETFPFNPNGVSDPAQNRAA